MSGTVTGLDLGEVEAAASDLLGMCSEAGYRDAVGILIAAVPSLLAAARAVQRVRDLRETGTGWFNHTTRDIGDAYCADEVNEFLEALDSLLRAALGTGQEGQR